MSNSPNWEELDAFIQNHAKDGDSFAQPIFRLQLALLERLRDFPSVFARRRSADESASRTQPQGARPPGNQGCIPRCDPSFQSRCTCRCWRNLAANQKEAPSQAPREWARQGRNCRGWNRNCRIYYSFCRTTAAFCIALKLGAADAKARSSGAIIMALLRSFQSAARSMSIPIPLRLCVFALSPNLRRIRSESRHLDSYTSLDLSFISIRQSGAALLRFTMPIG